MNLNFTTGPDIIIGYENYDLVSCRDRISGVNYVKNFRELGYEANSISKIRCLYTLAQIPSNEIYLTLSTWFNWLEKGGTLYIELYDAYLVSNNFVNGFIDIGKYSEITYADNKITSFSSDSFETMIKDIGYMVVDKGYFGHSFYFTLIK